jgi:DNA-binding CsgD family transcriptional regulator
MGSAGRGLNAMSHAHITPEKRQQIKEMLGQQLTTRAIAKRLHCSRSTITKIKAMTRIENNTVQVKRQLQITLDLQVKVTERPDGYLVVLDYGKPKDPEPFNAMEFEAIEKVTRVVDAALVRKGIRLNTKRDFRYKNVQFPSQFFLDKEPGKVGTTEA